MTYRVNRVAFDDLSLVLRIYKAMGLNRAEALDLFSAEANRRAVIDRYDSLEPLSVIDAMKLVNAEQRMAAMAIFPPGAVAEQTGFTTIDRQTVRKRQVRWDDSLQPQTVEFDDTYELLSFEIEGQELPHHSPVITVYVVRCICPSTERVFHLYVPPEIGQAGDAIAAVAWTMQIDGQPLTGDQYLDLVCAES